MLTFDKEAAQRCDFTAASINNHAVHTPSGQQCALPKKNWYGWVVASHEKLLAIVTANMPTTWDGYGDQADTHRTR
jgi:hypothetical protein